MAIGLGLSEGVLALEQQDLFWRRVDIESAGGSPLVLLHGAGVAGGLTWGPLIELIAPRPTLLVPDLRGAGHSRDPDGVERPFTVDQVVEDIVALLDDQRVGRCEVVGYSFGGLVAMRLRQRLGERIESMTLIEPGLLERAGQTEMLCVRQGYHRAAARVRSGVEVEAGIVDFLDLIAPRRSRHPRIEQVAIARLAERPLGFANALDCVAQAVGGLDRAEVIDAQRQVLCVVGAKSPETLRDYHHTLAAARDDWECVEIAGADHSLPFQKPRRIAALLDRASAMPAASLR
ncbi:alpha/beta fold hydrolase [Halotalea alkalilenta]|uniref:alpha/beta fold hydrolase n=1 Tax=Halotalea alkalilenta TaxID=376489 RepID=UPI0005BB8FC3|nr:alpha/beta hydrolase [Halotalea alkalilenta]